MNIIISVLAFVAGIITMVASVIQSAGFPILGTILGISGLLIIGLLAGQYLWLIDELSSGGFKSRTELYLNLFPFGPYIIYFYKEIKESFKNIKDSFNKLN
jgi:hypothetical protein